MNFLNQFFTSGVHHHGFLVLSWRNLAKKDVMPEKLRKRLSNFQVSAKQCWIVILHKDLDADVANEIEKLYITSLKPFLCNKLFMHHHYSINCGFKTLNITYQSRINVTGSFLVNLYNSINDGSIEKYALLYP